mmetsp:Transcript_49200/g.73150  ORF Transcript_49200/g.73150 Transcript_49200/m.73150 type:complete len:494 (-) Transcript_49200:156-1637(-)|eukprot:CAMPEP_0195535430 /NCGR_PEP_ID=MMETSP0794_2-20130614/44254_1 /TAXON_ID=515487 /ORGANISM="Stephanopyxis turris, Strain CCMP 815" /LENGTH=493 /DNA_ID=CAMNT_0040668569 /DNA_START=160 /DNA_END=1641 /DNA_ORIENTATION=-
MVKLFKGKKKKQPTVEAADHGTTNDTATATATDTATSTEPSPPTTAAAPIVPQNTNNTDSTATLTATTTTGTKTFPFPQFPPPPPPPSNLAYQNAIKKYSQTINPLTSNDDGRYPHARPVLNSATAVNNNNGTNVKGGPAITATATTSHFQKRQQFGENVELHMDRNGDENPFAVMNQTNVNSLHKDITSNNNSNNLGGDGGGGEGSSVISEYEGGDSTLRKRFAVGSLNSNASFSSTANMGHDHNDDNASSYHRYHPSAAANFNNSYAMKEPEMPDATYEETYGDAYVGAPIRYIYPSGYQSMRPRSGPWKLSLLVFAIFLWLSLFIVGYCADMVDLTAYNNNSAEIDDDELVMETRWCGSRLLYFMWVVSLSITGLAAAYCSIIGYIKVRDFTVANCRSQPPGMVGKSDYYVRIDDANRASVESCCNDGHHGHDDDHSMQDGGGEGGESYQRSSSHRTYYEKSIYQADGTPQFWGGHIYRPTQAAVAVTSR